MMSRNFALSSELTGAIAKRLPHAKNQLSAPGSFFNQFVIKTHEKNMHKSNTEHTACILSKLRGVLFVSTLSSPGEPSTV